MRVIFLRINQLHPNHLINNKKKLSNKKYNNKLKNINHSRNKKNRFNQVKVKFLQDLFRQLLNYNNYIKNNLLFKKKISKLIQIFKLSYLNN